MTTDVIDRLMGIEEGDALFALREQRPDAKANAQASFDALFASDELGHVSQLERLAVAAWTAALSQGPTASFYRDLLVESSPEVAAALDAAVPAAVTTGPYGAYPPGPLSAEDVDGLAWEPSAELVGVVGPRLAAALAHAHLLTYHPRDAHDAALQALLDAGWTTTGIVTLSQLVSFLHFQLRVVAGLRVLKEEIR